MKILYHHRIASKDGQFVHVQEIIEALKKQGHEVLLVGPDFHAKAEFGADGGWVTKLKKMMPLWLYELLELGYSLVVARKLLKAIKAFQPDVIYERYNLHQPAGVLVAKAKKVPLLLEVNAPLVKERMTYGGGVSLKWLAKKVEGFTWRKATAVLPVTKVLARDVMEAGVPAERIEVIHNGVRQALIDENRTKPVKQREPITIGFVGFMHLTCGVEEAIEVLAERRNQNIRLVCVGDGDVLPHLRQYAEYFRVADRVEFVGLVSRDDVLSYVDTFDIALQPAVTPYASPLKMFEYMAKKCLIVAPNTENIREILDRSCAILFDTDHRAFFKEALITALKEKDAESKREAAFERLSEKRFIWEENGRRIVRIAEQVMKK